MHASHSGAQLLQCWAFNHGAPGDMPSRLRAQATHESGFRTASIAPKIPTKLKRNMKSMAMMPPEMKERTITRGSPRNARSEGDGRAAAGGGSSSGRGVTE